MPGFTVVALGCFTPDGGPAGGPAGTANDAAEEGALLRDGGSVDAPAADTRASLSFPAPAFSVYESRAFTWALRAVPKDAVHWD
jgi:hypothetical protein